MLKYLAIFALLLLILPMQTYAQTNKARQTPKGNKRSPPVSPIAPKQNNSPNFQPKHQEQVGMSLPSVSCEHLDKEHIAARIQLRTLRRQLATSTFL